MTEELAIISGAEFGVRDIGRCVLWFGVEMLSGGALVVLDAKQAIELLERHGVRSVNDLNGMPCVVETDGRFGGDVHFSDLRPRK